MKPQITLGKVETQNHAISIKNNLFKMRRPLSWPTPQEDSIGGLRFFKEQRTEPNKLPKDHHNSEN